MWDDAVLVVGVGRGGGRAAPDDEADAVVRCVAEGGVEDGGGALRRGGGRVGEEEVVNGEARYCSIERIVTCARSSSLNRRRVRCIGPVAQKIEHPQSCFEHC